ncbi:energy-coupling factor transporter transmembrane component T family protein [Rhodococcus sp. NPDC058521]|uniref:energy-coupling factor transporter transmembrane component T family protein n=1 Tax=Rhodococcus sp. NPDC058521 TaxID=3346536 RepID=UPI0036521422
MTPLGIYQPGSSALHRLGAGPKMLLLVAAIVAVTVFVRQPWHLIPATLIVTGGYAIARIGIRPALAQLRTVLWMLLVIGVFQLIFTGWQRAVVVCGTLLLAVALAALVTLTTRVSDMLVSVTRGLAPLRRVGVNPERVALVLAMTVRCIPLLAGIIRQVSEARKARGLGNSLRAFAVPVVVSTLLTADAMGEALAARGADD